MPEMDKRYYWGKHGRYLWYTGVRLGGIWMFMDAIQVWHGLSDGELAELEVC